MFLNTIIVPKREITQDYTVVRNTHLRDTRVIGDPIGLYMWLSSHSEKYLVNQTLAREALGWSEHRFRQAKNKLREHGYLVEVIDRWPKHLLGNLKHLRGKPRYRLILRDPDPATDAVPAEMLKLESDTTINDLGAFMLQHGWLLEDVSALPDAVFATREVALKNQEPIETKTIGRTLPNSLKVAEVETESAQVAAAPATRACHEKESDLLPDSGKQPAANSSVAAAQTPYVGPAAKVVPKVREAKKNREDRLEKIRRRKAKNRFRGPYSERVRIDALLSTVDESLSVSALELALDGRVNLNHLDLVKASRQVLAGNRSPVYSPVDYVAKAIVKSPKRWALAGNGKPGLVAAKLDGPTSQIRATFARAEREYLTDPCLVVGHNWDYPRHPGEAGYCIRVKQAANGEKTTCGAPEHLPFTEPCLAHKHNFQPASEDSLSGEICTTCKLERAIVDAQYSINLVKQIRAATARDIGAPTDWSLPKTGKHASRELAGVGGNL